jgi:2-polyprenyl-3-methyl-5-hydroxy-6-metoxy-1,4-benzoquinol methylase
MKVQHFDKYGKLGAYHWAMLDEAADYRARVELLATLVRPHMDCLDLGCGDGAYMSRLAPLCQHVIGVDADADGIRLGRDNLAKHGVNNVTLVQARFDEAATALAAWERRIDLIYSMDVIEHLYDPGPLLDLMERMLAPDGLVVVGTPLFVTPESVSGYHIKEFRVAELEALLLPRFERIREAWLDACFPNVRGWAPRFYTFIGRAKKAAPVNGTDLPERPERRDVRDDLFVRLHDALVRIDQLESARAELQRRLARAEHEGSRAGRPREPRQSAKSLALKILRRVPGISRLTG